MLAVWLGRGGEKSLPVLLIGATVTGVLGAGVVLLLRGLTRLKEDAALGIVLSVFFGAGVCLLGWVQKMDQGHAAGLESFIYGKTASMVASDAKLIVIAGAGCVVLSVLFFKELRMICFDTGFARSQGWPVLLIDTLLMAMTILVVVIGLQAVGLILVIALLIVPPAAARFWTDRLGSMLVIAAAMGLASGCAGALLSAKYANLPSGAVIVLVAIAVFVFSMLFAPNRGVLFGLYRNGRLSRKIARQQFLRTLFELSEEATRDAKASDLSGQPGNAQAINASPKPSAKIPVGTMLARRSWSRSELAKLVRQGISDGTLAVTSDGSVQLSQTGLVEAARLTRNHRLWEIYLITHADIAPSHVDRDAHGVEHVLGEAMVAKLEALLPLAQNQQVPASPHEISGTNHSPNAAINSSTNPGQGAGGAA
jgi:manganese/zinc/iron transport system permease protein